jgi:hypothetical protein
MMMKLVIFALIAVTAGQCQPKFRSYEHDSCSAHDQDRLPKYRVVRKVPWKSIGILHVLIRPQDASKDNLISVGCAVGQRFAQWDTVEVEIFDSEYDAGRYSIAAGITGQEGAGEGLAGLKAMYLMGETGEAAGQALFYRDDPTSPYMTVRIDLGPPPKPKRSK